MASKRVAKSAVDWASFAQRVPPSQTEIFRAFKAKSESFVSRIHQFPEELPKIDWAMYKSKIAMPGIVDTFEKAYQSVSVPYPKDKANTKAKVDAEQKDAAAVSAKEIAKAREEIATAQAFVSKLQSLPPLEEFTQQMVADYFPEQARNPWEKPSIWPHTKYNQIGGTDSHEIK
ncbi:hypothetical protein NP493_625g01065 [Ridgeia piscesae]|uniref:ATP synthase subunit d, mitochondrial n=2 Tax=Ridgeia piscesae TaxID=27915 RepID=A0AAD9NNT1_RIDPI|nr:hypothetical protein NP493_625g01065 [Ridgeia piscesae]